MKIKIYLFWFFLVIMWNFGVPHATPLWDVLMAVILSMIGLLANSIMNEE